LVPIATLGCTDRGTKSEKERNEGWRGRKRKGEREV